MNLYKYDVTVFFAPYPGIACNTFVIKQGGFKWKSIANIRTLIQVEHL